MNGLRIIFLQAFSYDCHFDLILRVKITILHPIQWQDDFQ
jgi:hypothetical protein